MSPLFLCRRCVAMSIPVPRAPDSLKKCRTGKRFWIVITSLCFGDLSASIARRQTSVIPHIQPRLSWTLMSTKPSSRATGPLRAHAGAAERRLGPRRTKIGRLIVYNIEHVRAWLLSQEQPVRNSPLRIAIEAIKESSNNVNTKQIFGFGNWLRWSRFMVTRRESQEFCCVSTTSSLQMRIELQGVAVRKLPAIRLHSSEQTRERPLMSFSSSTRRTSRGYACIGC